eukprot:GHVR01137011.1.p1 GENE.GHVR01137011.1~~GHVR01137011.1.p1  ORF type:complete len:139 (-),score=45.44 GHVR01137011.1:280-696(-)
MVELSSSLFWKETIVALTSACSSAASHGGSAASHENAPSLGSAASHGGGISYSSDFEDLKKQFNWKLVCLGLGSFESSEAARLQLSMALNIQTLLEIDRRDVWLFDPVMTNLDDELVKQIGFNLWPAGVCVCMRLLLL